MTEKEKLILAMMQINSLLRLLEGNEYQKYLSGHLVKTSIELKRQLSNYG
jgi:hypothetical protein